jgi:hypothetical protein
MWALLLACADPQPPIPPAPVRDERTDVLLVTIDTLRADRVGAYGDPHASTAVMDALAAEGLLFREAHTVTPLTLPAHASLLSGLYPLHHGLRVLGIDSDRLFPVEGQHRISRGIRTTIDDDTVELSAVMDWARPQILPVTVVPDGGHFFHGQLPLLKGLVVRHLSAGHVPT